MLTGDDLERPPRLWTAAEVLAEKCPIPREPGLYTWYFREVPQGVPVKDCIVVDGATLLYIGISPKRPPANGEFRQPSTAMPSSALPYAGQCRRLDPASHLRLLASRPSRPCLFAALVVARGARTLRAK